MLDKTLVLYSINIFQYGICFTDDEGGRTDRTSGQLWDDSLGIQTPVDNHQSSGEPSQNQVSAPPPLCHLDLGVIESLPPELFTELNGIYGGKLVEFVAKNKREFGATTSHERVDGIFLSYLPTQPTLLCFFWCLINLLVLSIRCKEWK